MGSNFRSHPHGPHGHMDLNMNMDFQNMDLQNMDLQNMSAASSKPLIADLQQPAFLGGQDYGAVTTPVKNSSFLSSSKRTPKTPGSARSSASSSGGSARKRGRPSTKRIPGAEDPWMAQRMLLPSTNGLLSSELGSMPPSLAMLGSSSPVASSPKSVSNNNPVPAIVGGLSRFKVNLRPASNSNSNANSGKKKKANNRTSIIDSNSKSSVADPENLFSTASSSSKPLASSPVGCGPGSVDYSPVDDEDDDDDNGNGSENHEDSKLRGLSIKDIPSSPVQGFHINFHEELDDYDEHNGLENMNMRQQIQSSAGNKRKSALQSPSTESSLVSTPTRKRPRRALMRTRSLTTSPRYLEEEAGDSIALESTTETDINGLKDRSYVYGSAPLRRAYSELSYDMPSRYTASASFRASFGRRISLVISNGHASLASETPESDKQGQEFTKVHKEDPEQHIKTGSGSDHMASDNEDPSKPQSSVASTFGGVMTWDVSDDDSDLDSDFQGSDFYTTVADEKPVVIAGDAMTAFTRTIARTRAMGRDDEHLGAVAGSEHSYHVNYHGNYDQNYGAGNYHMVHTPFIQSHSFKHSSPHHFSLSRSPANNNMGSGVGPLHLGGSLLEAALTTSSSTSAGASVSQESVATPPGSMLTMDDSAFSTGMTPYLPSRSQNFRSV